MAANYDALGRDIVDSDWASSVANNGYRPFQSFISEFDLLNERPRLCPARLGDPMKDGVPMRTPKGELIPGKGGKGLLMGPVGADLVKVAEAGRAFGVFYRQMLSASYENRKMAYTILILGAGREVGHGGTFDWQREGKIFRNEFRYVSNVNVGLFSQQAGFSRADMSFMAAAYAIILWTSNTSFLHPVNVENAEAFEQGYKLGESGTFNLQ